MNNANCLQITWDKVNIFAIYRSPSCQNVSPFIDSLRDHLRRTSLFQTNLVIGDLNINIITNKHSQAESLLCMLVETGHNSGINTPTRIAGASVSCIDHIHLRSSVIAKTAVIKSTVTDHYSTIIGLCDHNCVKDGQSFYTLSKFDLDTFKDSISKVNWTNILNEKDTNNATLLFLEKLKFYLDQNTNII